MIAAAMNKSTKPKKMTNQIPLIIAKSLANSGLVIISYSACIKINHIKAKTTTRINLKIVISLFFTPLEINNYLYN